MKARAVYMTFLAHTHSRTALLDKLQNAFSQVIGGMTLLIPCSGDEIGLILIKEKRYVCIASVDGAENCIGFQPIEKNVIHDKFTISQQLVQQLGRGAHLNKMTAYKTAVKDKRTKN